MKRLIVLMGLCLLMQPQAVLAEAGKHPAIPGSQECGECHGDQEKAWFDGKHGLMNVKCIVCHGSTEKNFTASPGLGACRGCHAEQVAQAQKSKGKEGKSCFPCHDPHAVTVQGGAATPYHTQGGK